MMHTQSLPRKYAAVRSTVRNPNQPLRIVVADDEADVRQFLTEVLTSLGHQVVAAENGEQLVALCQTTNPDLIVTDVRMPALSGLQAAHSISQQGPVPIILVTGHPDADILEQEAGFVMACLSKPIKPADLIAAIVLATRRFEQFRQLTRETAGLRQALEDRKLIERAKGSVMKRLRVDEEEAFSRLQQMASSRNTKLVDVAKRIIEADEVFQRLDEL